MPNKFRLPGNVYGVKHIMTSRTRLKRKLVDLGVDLSSRKANENFCLIGTPLPPLEKSKDINEFVPLWKQDVRDEKGRRRLHGAFTGGFSAGYFNTVGSKEGWTPSTFVSSRSDRAKAKVARPEDFMDDEDIQELRESRTLVDTTEAMDLTGGSEAELARRATEEYESDPVRCALAQALIPPPKESAGAKVLKKMGWKPGHGIGPRISYRRRKLQDMQAKTGKVLTLADVVITEEEEEACNHKYPQREIPIPVYERKGNFHGLGYQPGLGLSESLGRSKAESENGPTISAGFGLGALNEADEDDIDIYDGGHKSSKSRIAYDISEQQDNDTVVLTQKPAKVEKNLSRPATIYATFSSGISVLQGFVVADTPVFEDQWHPGPEIPQGWKPDPKRVWESDPNKENIRAQAAKSEPLPHHKWKKGLTAEERGSLLGETPVSTVPRSVFEYVSQKDRERIQNLAASLTMAPEEGIRIPRTEPQIAQAALQGFQPFISDPAKHARYTAYLLSQADPNSTMPETLQPLPGQRTEEFSRELEDYAKAATIFKPMTGAMAGRFTSAVVIDRGPTIREGLHTPSAEDVEKYEAEEAKRQEEKLTPQQNAAKMGMYGPMTREVRSWQPARLLCKRFGVKDPELRPDAESGDGTAATTTETSWQEQAGIPVPASDVTPVKRDFDNVGLGEDETQGVDTLTYQRPSMDIFKAIFASDEEESGDEDPKEEEEGEGKEGAEGDVGGVTAKFFPEFKDEGPVDLNTFKPTFIPRDRKQKGKDVDAKKKKDKEKKKKDKVLVSFEMEEEGGGSTLSSKRSKDKDNRDTNRPKKKRKVKERQEEGGGASKAPATAAGEAALPEPSEPAQSGVESTPANKGRKRAIDFM